MSSEFEEPRVVGRQEELRRLREFFREHLKERKGGSLYVCGRSGTGKTEAVRQVYDGLMREFGSNDKSPTKKKKSMSKLIWLTGAASSTGNSFFSLLAKECGLEIRDKDVERSLATELTKSKREVMYVVVVDEIDLLSQDVVRLLFDWASSKSNLVLLGIANIVNAGTKLFKTGESQPNELPFTPYDVLTLRAILETKLGEKTSRFGPSAIEMCARKVQSTTGDVRDCLRVCTRLLGAAEPEKLISISDVVKCMGATPQSNVSKRIGALPTQAKFALVACAVAHRKLSSKEPLVDENSNTNRESTPMEDKFTLILPEKSIKDAWQDLRDIWKVQTEGSIIEQLDGLIEIDLLEKQVKKKTPKAPGSVGFCIKPTPKEILSALTAPEADAAEAQTDMELVMRRPIVMALQGIRARVMANMHAPLDPTS